MSTFVEVILPLALPKQLTYAVPAELQGAVQVGVRVAAPLGKRKIYAAVVLRIHSEAPAYATKPILSVIDDAPLVNACQLRLWAWVAQYYACTLGEVMSAALPAMLKMEGEAGALTLAPLQSRYKPRTETYVSLPSGAAADEAGVRRLFDLTKRAPQQEQLLVAYLSLAASGGAVPKKALLEKAGSSAAVLKACVDKGIFALREQEVSRVAAPLSTAAGAEGLPALSPAQEQALEGIRQCWQGEPRRQVALLHGVTSSGKTEVYMHLIAQALGQGRQVLYLLPEIALTAQLISRLQKVFGSVGVYHSKFSDAERVETYRQLLAGAAQPALILGVRSSLFLPFSNLGLVIVDEEHENTYKQQDPAPRYHARDAAIVMATLHGAQVLLGSATPSVESYHNATTGKYGLVELAERYGRVELPEVQLVNVSYLARQQGQRYLSPPLLLAIEEALAKGEQVILFQNRRGFSPYVECKECGWVPQCEHCNVSLTYHKRTGQLVCHYCGFAIGMPHRCLACEGANLETQGFGTEKVEDDLRLMFPNAVVERMDLDSTRSRNAYERIIADFERRKIQILVGTQMITKGLDFDNVSLVGILNADAMLSYADFRAGERSYQLMSQVAGRAGRRGKQGRVLVQTKQPRHPILAYVQGSDYKGMFLSQLAERREFLYPPFARLIRLTLRHRSEQTLYRAAAVLSEGLKRSFANRVFGPETPLVNRVKNRYMLNFLLKIERGQSPERAKALLRMEVANLLWQDEFKRVEAASDVDPM